MAVFAFVKWVQIMRGIAFPFAKTQVSHYIRQKLYVTCGSLLIHKK